MADVGADKQSDDSHSSDSDVAIIVPRRAKRRRILQGSVPITASVYSNKVTSSLTLIPDNISTLAHMEKELQKKQGCEDLEGEVPVEPPPVQPAASTYDLSDPEEAENDKTTRCDRVRDSSPSPPPTPKTPVRKKRKGMNQKIRKMEERLQDLGTVLSPLRGSDNDVIVMGSSPPPELTIKVRRRGKIFRITIRPVSKGDLRGEFCTSPAVKDVLRKYMPLWNEPFQSLMDQYKAAMGLANNVCFMFEGQKLNGRNTPQEIGLESDDIIEAWA
ncbi:NFATC2-interacting protein-like [Anomaloglossus baeobatrachus]